MLDNWKKDPPTKKKKKKKQNKKATLPSTPLKTMEHENDGDTNYNWCTRCSHQRIDTGSERLGNKLKSRDHPKYCIIEIDQNTKKSPGDLRRLAVTQDSREKTSVNSQMSIYIYIYTLS